jgi:hypothetical protein
LARRLRPEAYAYLLDQAAVTGYLPKIDQFGQPILTRDEETVVPVKDRVQAIQYLLDKVLPAAKATEAPSPVDPLQLAEAAMANPSTLSAEELVRIAGGGDPNPDPHPVVHEAQREESIPSFPLPHPNH